MMILSMGSLILVRREMQLLFLLFSEKQEEDFSLHTLSSVFGEENQ